MQVPPEANRPKSCRDSWRISPKSGSKLQLDSIAVNAFVLTARASATMPPRLQLCLRSMQHAAPPSASIPTFLVPFLHHRTRHASILASLSDLPASYNKKIRRGRGPSSGKGKTSGRGHKGQGQKGTIPARFRAGETPGQTPDEIVRGKEGFKNVYVTSPKCVATAHHLSEKQPLRGNVPNKS